MTWVFNCKSFSKKKEKKAVHFAHEEKKVRVVGLREWQQPKQVVKFPGI